MKTTRATSGKRGPAPAQETALVRRIRRTLTDLVGLSSVSGQEDDVRVYLRARLVSLGLAPQTDAAGNLITAIPGDGVPLLLNAHMDRVPPGRGHIPVVEHGVMRSDGATNLGADDAAGLAIIVETLAELRARDVVHRPAVVLFTTAEEVGMRGAAAFDPDPWHIAEGLVFDNAGPAGAVVTRGASYIAFDAVIRGRGGHPGKDLTHTLSAIDIFRRTPLPVGSLDGDTTRISIGQVSAGTARNAIPIEARVTGEVRTLLAGEPLRRLLASIERDFVTTAQHAGGAAECRFEPHGAGYTIPAGEPLLLAWQHAWSQRGHPPATLTSFIGSDANALRARLRAFTISTGVTHEHTVEEQIALAPLGELVETAIMVLSAQGAVR